MRTNILSSQYLRSKRAKYTKTQQTFSKLVGFCIKRNEYHHSLYLQKRSEWEQWEREKHRKLSKWNKHGEFVFVPFVCACSVCRIIICSICCIRSVIRYAALHLIGIVLVWSLPGYTLPTRQSHTLLRSGLRSNATAPAYNRQFSEGSALPTYNSALAKRLNVDYVSDTEASYPTTPKSQFHYRSSNAQPVSGGFSTNKYSNIIRDKHMWKWEHSHYIFGYIQKQINKFIRQ